MRGLAPARLLRRAHERERIVKGNVEDLTVGFERAELVVVLHVRTEAAEVGDDRLVVVRMQTHLAWKRQQLQRLFERDRLLGHARLQR